ncbi:MAG: DUF2752 domain-containing protein [Elusimicrobia bacterium]|nr:DUF2752 domain-containing protein [Elusimicrobiota bacterium]
MFETLALCAWAAVAACAAGTGLGLWSLETQGRIPLCLFKAATGIPCPGCGMGHALILAFRGQFEASVHAHALGIPVLLLWTVWLANGLRNARRGKEFSAGLPFRLEGAPGAVAALVVILAYALRG